MERTRRRIEAGAILVTVTALAFMLTAGTMPQDRGGQPPLKWAVCYSDREPIEAFAPYDLLILDSDYHPPLRALSDRGKTLLGYLSIGEVESEREHFEAVRQDGIVLDENPFWKGSYFVDVRSQLWAKRIVEELIPRILRKGFHGLFLDTADNAAHLERTDPAAYRGMTDAMAQLILGIRAHYPTIKIALNRGFEVLPEVAAKIDYEMAESLRADYDFATRQYRMVPEAVYRQQVDLLHNVQRAHPALVILALDYWNPDDADGIRRLYQLERAAGFHPYVATLELDRIVPEPARP